MSTTLSPAFLRSPAAKVVGIAVLLLAMQVPLSMVASLIAERQERQAEVLSGFRRGWGPDQVVAGPILVVPYSWPDRTPVAAGGPPLPPLRGWARLPAAGLELEATLAPEQRRRGLFTAIVYAAQARLQGRFALPALDLRQAPGATVDWAGARVLLGAGDLRGIAAGTQLELDGRAVRLDPVDAAGGCGLAYLSAPAGLQGPPEAGATLPFRVELTLRGTSSFRVLPSARQTAMTVAAPWPTPSFVGASLPLRYDLGADGFRAAWDIAGPAAAWQQREQEVPSCHSAADAPLFAGDAQPGVELQERVPTYLMVERASKYGALFLALSFLTVFLFEQMAGARVHLVQYGLLGLSVSLFALLLVSVAEPAGFAVGYAVATAMVLGQASLYAVTMVGRRLALVFAGVLAALFGFLYVVLRLDSYALLSGAVALFVVLSVVMAVTRRVAWSRA